MTNTAQRTVPSKTWQWLVDGWHSLRDKASEAVTYFTPQHEDESKSQRWAVLASDVTEQKDNVCVELELPGLEKADLSVEVHKDRLRVMGSKNTSSTRKDGSLVITERAYGQFQRIIPMPCDVTSEGTKAKYANGVLTVTIPKQTSNAARTIPISTR